MQARTDFDTTLPEVELEVTHGVMEPLVSRVVLVNDDYTPMEFVAGTLSTVFQMDETSAANVTMQAHYQGKALCGIYPREIAEAKVNQVIEAARKNGHPLLCTTETL
jgi:ATP-dependent Clp protease adaptor protein ClpS